MTAEGSTGKSMGPFELGDVRTSGSETYKV